MLHLPIEIITMILSNLFVEDLFSARLVCKQLRDVAASIISRHFTFRHNEAGYLKLLQLSTSGDLSQVQRLTYEFRNCATKSFRKSQFVKYMKQEGEDEWNSPAQINDLHKSYRSEHDFLVQLYHDNLDIALWTSAFCKVANLKSLHIIELADSWIGEDGLDETASSHDDESADDESADDGSADDGILYGIPTDTRPLKTLVKALYAAGTKLESLKLESRMDLIMTLPQIVAGLQSLGLSLMAHPFECLKRLSITSEDDSEDVEIAKFISSLPLLEELSFSNGWLPDLSERPLLMKNFLAGLSVPRLQAVNFRQVSFPSSAFLIAFFLRHARCLQTISMENVLVTSGSWAEVFSRLRQSLSIRYCQMDELFYTSNGWVREIGAPDKHGLPILRPRAIEDFVENRSNIGPYQLLQRRPDHLSLEDNRLCQNGTCPYRSTATDTGQDLRVSLQN